MIKMRAQQGVALIAVIFLLVALGALAVYLVTISGVQQQTPTLSADAARAYYIARSAAEGIGQQAAQEGCPGSPPASLEGFDLIVDCQLVSNHQEAGVPFDVFMVEITASKGSLGSGNYVSRTVKTTVRSQN